jgi:hypothetical protein
LYTSAASFAITDVAPKAKTVNAHTAIITFFIVFSPPYFVGYAAIFLVFLI